MRRRLRQRGGVIDRIARFVKKEHPAGTTFFAWHYPKGTNVRRLLSRGNLPIEPEIAHPCGCTKGVADTRQCASGEAPGVSNLCVDSEIATLAKSARSQ
jgi:hypothetical protein